MPSHPDPSLVLYHADCPDGFGAAWSYWKKWGSRIRYEPLYYQQPVAPEVTGEDVVMVDVSMAEGALLALRAQANSLRVLDHHQSAADDLGHLPFTHFDLRHSGAVLAWRDVFGADEPVPLLLRLIQDRDLNQWLEPCARECLLVLDSLPRTFEAWSAFAHRLDTDFQTVCREGAIMAQQYQGFVHRFSHQAQSATLAGLPTYLVNVPNLFAHDVAAALFDFTPFVITWQVGPDSLAHLSFRSRRGHFDTIPLTTALKGGGSPSAGGARITLHELGEMYQGHDLLKHVEPLHHAMRQAYQIWRECHQEE